MSDNVIALLLGRAAFQSEACGAVMDLRRAMVAISDFDSALSMAALNRCSVARELRAD